MNSGVVTLMLITTTGFYTGPRFDTAEECEALSSEITHFTTFCHYKEPIGLAEYGAQLEELLEEFRNEAERKDLGDFGKPEVDL